MGKTTFSPCCPNKIDSMDIDTDSMHEACNIRKVDVRRVIQMIT